MLRVPIEELERDFSSFLHRVQAGESLLLMQAGKPMAEVKPVPRASKSSRPFGLCSGEFVVPPDFDQPLPESFFCEIEDR